MKTQLVVLLGARPVEAVNALAQIVALLVGAVLFYQSAAYQWLKRNLARLVSLKRYVYFSLGPTRFGFGIGNQPAPEDAPPRVYLLTASLVVMLFLLSHQTLTYWATYPFRQAAAAVTVWAKLSMSWYSLVIPFKSVVFAVWAVLSLLLIWSGGFGVTFKALLLLLDSFHRNLSRGCFNLLLFSAFVVSGIVIVLTGTDVWSAPTAVTSR